MPPGPLRHVTVMQHNGRNKIHIYTNESKQGEMDPARQNPIQRPVKLFKKLCNYIMLHNTTQLSSSINLLSNSRPTSLYIKCGKVSVTYVRNRGRGQLSSE